MSDRIRSGKARARRFFLEFSMQNRMGLRRSASQLKPIAASRRYQGSFTTRHFGLLRVP